MKNWQASQPNNHGFSHMAYKDSESGDVIEAVLTIQGYIQKMDLPLILTMPK